MSGKTVPLSVRVSDEDALFLANLVIDDAVTPSEKLRAILHAARRRSEGVDDVAAGELLLREMTLSGRQTVQKLEAKAGRKSDVILKLYERLPELVARLMAGPIPRNRDPLKKFEGELLDSICVLLKDFLALGLTTPVRVHDENNFLAELEPIVKLAGLLTQDQQRLIKENENE